jgi:hypothetical protein
MGPCPRSESLRERLGAQTRDALPRRSRRVNALPVQRQDPLSINLSEGQFRVTALGRKNYMSVGAESARQWIAALCTLTACCKRGRIDPGAYLTDVLRRLGRDPDCSVDELMPHRWKPLDTS